MQTLAVIGATALGARAAEVLWRQHPDLSVGTVLSRRPTLAFCAPIAIGAAAALLVLGTRPMVTWSLPLWSQRLARPVSWGILISAVAYPAAAGVLLGFRARHEERSRILVLGLLVVAMFEAGQIALTWPIVGEVHRRQNRRGWVMETTFYTCAPAVGATIAHALGVGDPTEKSLARSMGSSMSSTTPADFIEAMGKVGVRCAQRDVPSADLMQVRAPALLFIDQVEDGPEGHAAAVLSVGGGYAEIWDPRKGHYLVTGEEYAYFWHGRAIECSVTAP